MFRAHQNTDAVVAVRCDVRLLEEVRVTASGKALRLIAVDRDRTSLEAASQAGWEVLFAESDDPETLSVALQQLGVTSERNVLHVRRGVTAAQLPALARTLGQSRLLVLDMEGGEAFLDAAAGAGLFNDGGFVKRDHLVRHAVDSDLDRLCELEELCWQHTRTSRERIAARIRTYPQGQLVLEKDGNVLGVIYSQRIANVDALTTRTAADVHELHDASGATVQLLAVNLDPRAQNAGYGDQLLEFMLQRAAFVGGVERVVGVTLCKRFDAAGSLTFEQYIRQQGSDQDPVLAFHYAHGAEIVKAVPGYRPEDRANLHNGVLVAYEDLQNRPQRRQVAAVANVDRAEIARFVQAEAARLLRIAGTELDLDRPVMEMGLDSADLLKLQRLCEERFGVQLHAAFFFEHSTTRKVIEYFAAKLAPAAEVARPAVVEHVAPRAFETNDADVAVVGMACKLPGGIETPEDLWRVLSSGQCVIGSFPTARRAWPTSAEYAGIDRGGFVADADAFDAAFFRISPVEAQITDPQQRMLMQLAWSCLEDAGILPAALKGSNTGVFVGASNTDYSRLVQEAGLEIEAHNGVGSSLAILANRISYFFDLSGPSLVVDTACSSSLVALHSAVQSLRSGECSSALVGGVNLITHPDLSIAYHKAGMLAPDGLCKVFDAGANGYVRAEGSVVFLLKPLRAAIEEGHRIHAVIRGTATNHGGLAGGLTVPNPQKQKELLLAAWKDAGIAARDLTYIEAHGTGTSLGDPIEIQGIQAACAESSPDQTSSCSIGSLKSNLGHLESAAGISGLLKVIVSMQRRQLPASVNYSQLNPKIRLTGTPLAIQDRLTAWDAAQPRLAAVSSFGSGGANAHVVVQELANDAVTAPNDQHHLFVLSAANEERLRAYAIRVAEWLEADGAAIDFAGAIYTWQTGRTAMKHRLAIKVKDRRELAAKLAQWLAGAEVADVWTGHVGQKDSTLARMWHTKSGRQLVDNALIEKDIDALGPIWVSGSDIDWRKSHENAAIVTVPTYPFAKDRFWIEATAAKTVTIAAAASVIHPLLHTNTSNLSQQSYSATFSGEELFLADHQVRAEKVLPGVAYLEMTRAAIEHALPSWPEATALELINTVWIQPISVSEPTEVRVALLAEDDEQIDYEISSDNGIHCQGQAVLIRQPQAARVDVEALRNEMTGGRLEANEIYAAFSRMGLIYGPAFRAITSIERGNGQLLANLRLPQRAENASYVLHPSVMDGAIQAAVGLADGWSGSSTEPRLPFALESLRVLAPCTSEMVAWVRYAAGSNAGDKLVKIDIDLCDARGNVCVELHGFTSRVPGRETSAAAASLFARPVWEAENVVPASVEYSQHHVLVCEPFDADGLASLIPQSRCASLRATGETIADRYTASAVSSFERIQSILQSRPQGRVLVQLVVAGDDVLLAGLSGLLKTAALENPQITGQLILVPASIATEELAARLIDEMSATDPVIRYRNGLREIVRWQEVTAEPESPIALNDRGVYLITGGFGGLGLVFAKEILAQTSDARVILTGRSPLTAEKRSTLDELARAGYRQVDLNDRAQVEQLIASIVGEHGRLDGILHCAGMIADDFIIRKPAAQFREVLAPKVTGTYHLDLATRELALDFFVLFSSIYGAMGNVGQADYAAGNAFMDQFAAWRNAQRRGRTVSINWPLWQDGGMTMDAASREQMQRSTGMVPLQTSTGLRAFHRALALPFDQVLVVEGDAARIRRSVIPSRADGEGPSRVKETEKVLPFAQDDSGLAEKAGEYLRKQFANVLKMPVHKIDPAAALEEYGIDSMLAMKLTGELEETFGSLSKTLFFEYQTIRDLAGYFVKNYAAQLTAILGITAPVPVAVAPVVAQPVPAPAPRRFKRARTAAVEPQADFDSIAIVGLSGRYPEAANIDAYWQNLREGKDCIVEVPRERWDWRTHFSEDRNSSGHHYSKWGGFIEGVDEFDPLFFNISPAEARYIDPQERLFLQQAWMAVEDAGYTRSTLQVPCRLDMPGQIGVYVGVMWSEYQLFGSEASVHDLRMAFAGNLASIANRVSYALNLHGPSVTLDTMCSSSLTAIHFACLDLKMRRTSMAIAGGVNVSIHPNKYLMLSIGQFISSDGHCQSFGEGGDGYIPGEGVGVVVLKRLADAVRDGDHVYGVIRGSALTHGGKTNGYTVPNPQAQAGAITRALDEARIDARHISYVEAHGTGTKLGDPIEIAALSKVFQQSTQDTEFCLIGSAKSNIGHCESAAGIAGLTKVLLQMRHREIVPSLHSAKLNPHIDFGKSPFVVNQTLRPWEQPVVDGRTLPRIAGISSFGAGGSNAHLVVEEYLAPVRAAVSFEKVAILLSARTPEQLRQKAQDLVDFVRPQLDSIDLTAMAYTLQIGREAMEERLGLVVTSAAQLIEKLTAWLAGDESLDDAFSGQVKRNKESISLFSSDADLQQAVEKWLTSHKLTRLLEVWVKGLELDWGKLYGENKPARVSLPAYPFARERHWIDFAAVAATNATAPVLHPLLHSNTSDLSEQRFRSTFTGEEFFLADHQLATNGDAGRKVLPGVAYLEMVRVAIEQAVPARPETVELRNIVWMRPIVVADKIQVSIALSATDDRIDFQIFSQDLDREIVHCEGVAVLSSEPAPARLDVSALESRISGTIEPAAHYAACERMGLVYGPRFRAIEALRRGDGEVIARLRMPAAVAETLSDYVLHPSLMDAALQAGIALNTDGDQPRLPFALDALRIHGTCTSDMLAWVRPAAGGKLDVDLCDSDGNVRVQFQGLSLRAMTKNLSATAAHNSSIGTLVATPVWQPDVDSVGTDADFVEHHVIVCELPSVAVEALETALPGGRCIALTAEPSQTIARRYTSYAIACFERIQSIFQSKPQGNVLFQIIVPNRDEQSLLAGLSGLLRTAALENPQFAGQIILVPSDVATGDLAVHLLDERGLGLDSVIRYVDGKREVLRWQDVPAGTDKAEIAFEDDGVYLITGGLGGLGVLFAREILEQTRQARVILTGRSPLSAEREALLSSQLRRSATSLDGAIDYRQVDLNDPEQVERLVAAVVADYGRLDGVLHSAGMISDNFIIRKTAAQFSDVLAPKVDGTFHLDLATRGVALDFFVLFSSTTGALGNLGQADYAAANGFMDQFAAHRNRLVDAGERRGVTRSINWPLWQAGGMAVDRAGLELLQQTVGMHPMQTATGMQTFHRSLSLPFDQVLVVEGDVPQVRRALTAGRVITPSRPAVAASSHASTEAAEDFLRRELAELLKLPAFKIDPQAQLEEYGIDSVLAMKLVNRLEQTFGTLSKTLAFEYQTVRALTTYFVANHAAQVSALFAPAAKPEAVTAIVPAPAPVKTRPVSTRRFSKPRSAAPAVAAEAEPIAIIGLSGRYPGAVDVDAYWQNLREGKDCIVEVPKARWDWQTWFTEDRTANGKHYSKWGGFIEGVEEFDPQFFNIAPKEAKYIDPQERLFLQHAWMAIEDAGYTRAGLQVPQEQDLAGQAGVYVGVMWSEYHLFGAAANAEELRMGFAGNLASIANRVSYALNLHGPSMTLDTMCSSSLTAVHLACQDLRLGRTNMAIAGGVNVSVHPHKYLMLSVGQFISSDGHCQSFGEGGDGYIPGEGVGVVVLKRLSDAVRDGDHIYGTIRGSALTHGGKTNGYTVPNPQAQASAVSRALAESQIDARHISYVEAHGTGTKLGDPIEIAALSKVFQQHTRDTEFCLIGSAKSNIGHCESAAGIAGLTKVLLQMQHRQIVPSLHSAQLNPHIDFGKSPFVVNQVLRGWEQPVIDGRALPRIAGISSFGAGGSNAHMLIEEYAAPVRQPIAFDKLAVVLSARTAEQLRQKARDLVAFLTPRADVVDLADVAWTLQVGREAMDERLALVVDSAEELIAKLEAYVAGRENIADTFTGSVKRNREALALFTADADLQQTVEKWIAGRKLPRLLDLWVKGLDVEWPKLWGAVKPQRVSLPAYPFARERYWIDVTPAKAPVETVVETVTVPASVIHPLLHVNESDLNEQRYRSTFDEPLAPAAYLEMARAAVQHAQPEIGAVGLREVVWAQPLAEAKEVVIALWPNGPERIDFEIYTEPDVVLCQGSAVAGGVDDVVLDLDLSKELPSPEAVEEEITAPAVVEEVALVRREIVLAQPVQTPIAAPLTIKKRSTVALAAPTAAVASSSSAARPRITLSNASAPVVASSATSSTPVRLFDRGNGIVSIELVASRANDTIARVLDALDRAAQDASIKVLLLSGIEHCFGGRNELNEAIDRKLFQRLVSFPYPVVGVLQGDVIGAGFLAAALCDFLVCNEDAQYGYTDLERAFHPTVAEAAIITERFGSETFAYDTAPSTGRELRAKGWTCPILPWAEVEAHAERLAVTLSTKSRDALRLLKAHLSRELVSLVDGLSRVEEKAADSQNEIAVIELGEPMSDSEALDLQRSILESEVPVIAALTGDARGNALLVAQYCDAAVYSASGTYSAVNIGAAFTNAAVAVFTHRLGEAAAEILLTGADYSGAELRQRANVVVADDVLATAKQLAASWGRLPRTTLTAWKKQTVTKLHDATRTLAAIAVEPEVATVPATEPFVLRSQVVRANVHAGGIVVVRLEDRDAKNMFSDALVEGVREVFAHIEATPAYKVVVLTGYDNYFASGGTKESLLAIQEGRTKFTDFGIFDVALKCKLPVIAAMQGHGIGAGWSLGMFADIVLVSDESRYVSPYMNYGFTPGAGATWSLTRKMGRDLSRESLLTATQYAGRELKERGLALRVLPRTEVEWTAMTMAAQIARASRERLIALKRRLNAGVQPIVDDTFARELAMHEQTFVGRADTLAQIESNFHEEKPAPVPAAAPQPVAIEAPSAAAANDASVVAMLRTLLANELQIAENDLDDAAQFVDLGLDSITGVTWIRKINQTYKTTIEATKVYSFPTLKQLGRYVKEEAEKLGTLPAPAAAPAVVEAALTVVEAAPAVVQAASVIKPVEPKPAPVRAAKPAASGKLTSRRGRKTARVAEAPAQQRPAQPIAIIGMAGQFPQANNLEEFWQNIAGGKNCITEVPARRWDMSQYYQPGDAAAGKTNSRWMGALEGYDLFDPLFFSISPTEAESMDPQQRLFLQSCWSAIENAGYDAWQLSGSKCGVFVGVATGDYHLLSREQRLSAQGFIGDATSILAARISYLLNLVGPSLSIDTACSSSLVALAQACDSLAWGDAYLALAGGVYVMAGPEMHIKTAQAGMLSPDGKCYTFDQRANGFVPGEGVGVVLLKRLADAERDGDVIHAVINGWGVNQDGKTNGITAPNPESQTRLEQDVYSKYGIDPASIQLIEAHGTGTKLGDPIEVEGLKSAFKKFTDKRAYCALGSVKSNIGHTLTAAGIAGTLKLVLALKHEQLPPTINFERINEHIDLEASPFYVNSTLRTWERGDAPARQAAISSFGFSGTNAHVVVGEYQGVIQSRADHGVILSRADHGVILSRADGEGPSPAAVILSARTPAQLEQKVRDLLAFVRNTPSVDLADVAYTLQIGRAAMDERLGFVAGSLDQLANKLQSWLENQKVNDVFRGHARRDKEHISVIAQDEEMKDAIVQRLIAQQSLSKLVGLWVKGLDLDWNKLYRDIKPRRVSLPTYPFARERYWIDVTPAITAAAATTHPLLHRNTSDLDEQRYSSTFTGDEPFLADHRVRSQKVLPGVASLEMVRAAIAQAWPRQLEGRVIELHDTLWLKPVVVEGGEEVSVALIPTDDHRVDFEIFTERDGEITVHCQGQASFVDAAAPSKLDLTHLRRLMDRGRIESSQVYRTFEEMGLSYGPAHQGVTGIQLGDEQLLADLRLPAVVESGRGAYVLHPSLMDSALQASIGLFTADGNPAVPFALDTIRVFSACTREMAAWVRYAGGTKPGETRFDIDLCDADGTVCVEMRGFALRSVTSNVTPPAIPKLPIKKGSSHGDDFYEKLIADVMTGRLSVDDAVEIS